MPSEKRGEDSGKAKSAPGDLAVVRDPKDLAGSGLRKDSEPSFVGRNCSDDARRLPATPKQQHLYLSPAGFLRVKTRRSSPLVLALFHFLYDLRRKRVEVAGVARCNDAVVGYDLSVFPLPARVDHIGLDGLEDVIFRPLAIPDR